MAGVELYYIGSDVDFVAGAVAVLVFHCHCLSEANGFHAVMEEGGDASLNLTW